MVKVVSLLPESPGINVGAKLHQVSGTVCHIQPLLSRAPIGVPHQFAKERKVMVVERIQNDVTVLGL